MIRGIGIDIVEKSRISSAVKRFGSRFAEKILTQDELAEYEARKGDIDWLAGRFSAKEALSKAIGTGMSDGIWFKDFCVGSFQGKPVVKLKNKAEKKAGTGRLHVSISHERNYAVSVALFEKGIDQ
ncbi:holo-ACP synthase [candidate division WOR-3 bacterium]|nr:holo-ACP synthase [candidate division WOR-3 bacterium]